MELLQLHLEAFVPIEIRTMQCSFGCPDDWQFEEAKRRLSVYRESNMSEAFLFPMSGTGRAIGLLVECLAVLAFMPGGIKAFGLHFEA